ncbi:hypothetical protein SK128_017336 [Halocaridina rubra]|uniref:Uncharacterized protein n=1 Tax=Halocaridina rubra TaxID=373956 RepID=A0AAN8X4X0_HALRR
MDHIIILDDSFYNIRLDWNLLSTASPSINAWMNPSDRLTVAVIHFLHSSESRRLGVMASLMAEALDLPSIHAPVKGVVVLSRQWKNALFMPLLMEQTFRNKQTRPTYTYRPSTIPEGRTSPKFDPTLIASEVTDEKTTLLEAEGGSLHSRHDAVQSNTIFSDFSHISHLYLLHDHQCVIRHKKQFHTDPDNGPFTSHQTKHIIINFKYSYGCGPNYISYVHLRPQCIQARINISIYN